MLSGRVIWPPILATLCTCFPPALEQDVAIDSPPSALDSNDASNLDARRVVFAGPVGAKSLDILLVVDNSFSMRGEQAALGDSFPDFFGRLGAVELPSLHVGVISPNLGTAEHNIPGCGFFGDDGDLQGQPRGECVGPTPEAWIEDLESLDGRVRNYEGELVEAVRCIANLGVSGCGFEQHLSAVVRALDPGHERNLGFLRSDAVLAVIILADEDDCSASDPRLFTFETTDELGPLDSFRCSEFGLICDGRRLARAPGAYSKCVPRADSPFLRSPADIAASLRSLKGSGGLYVAAIVAPGEGLEVVSDETRPAGLRVAEVCGASDSDAAPGIRFQAFLDEFPGRSRRFSICGADYRKAMSEIGQELSGLVGGPICLGGPSGALQGCKVFDVLGFERANEERIEIPRCQGANTPCFELSASPGKCPETEHHMSLRVDRPRLPRPGTTLVVECEAPRP